MSGLPEPRAVLSGSALNELVSRVGGRVTLDEPLARYTTYRIGGPASALVRPRHADDIAAVVRFCAESGTRWLALGLGSNVLIADTGFDGVVIRVAQAMDDVVEGVGGAEVWKVGAGLPTPRLARRTARAGLAGVHRLIGVPGTVGGGVFMNAGAHGQDFSQVVRSVEYVGPDGSLETVEAADIRWRYRASGLDGTVVTAATVALVPADPELLLTEIRRHFRWRRRGTPFDQPCCGSVFRNPTAGGGEARTAGKLIDTAGLKGFQIGGAQVSEKHGNYIVNVGGATAADVRAVIDAVRERVLREFAVTLELEVKLVD